MRTIFTVKSIEDLKSKYKPGSTYNLGQTLRRLEATKRNLRYARYRFLTAKISLLSLLPMCIISVCKFIPKALAC